MTPPRVLATLGVAAALARRVGLGRPASVLVDAVDALLVAADAPLLSTRFEDIELRGYLRHRGFLAYVGGGMREETYYRDLVVSAVDAETTFVDAGAHIGVYTLLTCSRARRVLAFEPDPYNFSALRRNVERARCANVDVRLDAIADHVGDAEFRSFRSTFSGSLAPRDVDVYRTINVKTISLDAVLSVSDCRNLVVKLDVEGAEPRALEGMSASIRGARRLSIFAEVNPGALEAAGSTAGEFFEGLSASGLDCHWIDENRRTLLPVQPILDEDRLRKGNVMCVKRKTG